MEPETVLSQDPILSKRKERSERIIKYSVIGIAVIGLLMLIFLVVQVYSIKSDIQNSLTESKNSAANNHAKTRQYVKCIADSLLKPVSERTSTDFDDCGIEGAGDASVKQ